MPFSFIMTTCSIFLAITWVLHQVTADPTFHLTIQRRGGSLATHEPANLAQLTELVQRAETRYGQSGRTVKDNKAIRTWETAHHDNIDGSDVLNRIADPHSWYTVLQFGEPPQSIEMDLDMLVPDFYLFSTTSQQGSKFESFFSTTHNEHKRAYVHPNCKVHTDLIHLANGSGLVSQRIKIPTCSPPKFSRNTQHPHGGLLGLSPSDTMGRLISSALTQELQSLSMVGSRVWSLTLFDRERGLLTLGGSIARAVEEAKIRTHIELDNVDNPLIDRKQIDKEVDSRILFTFPNDQDKGEEDEDTLPWADVFRWSSVEGADGWWTTLMSGAWVNGAKVLKNQPVLLDLQVPFILAPPIAAQTFYAGIGGAKKLPEPHDRFYAFPCLNPPNLAFEYAGWMFPTMNSRLTMEDAMLGPLGGRFSLGTVRDGSGYCVGAVIESRLGQTTNDNRSSSQRRENLMNSGLHHTWVLGEPFFQGIGVVFDAERKKIGFRTY